MYYSNQQFIPITRQDVYSRVLWDLAEIDDITQATLAFVLHNSQAARIRCEESMSIINVYIGQVSVRMH